MMVAGPAPPRLWAACVSDCAGPRCRKKEKPPATSKSKTTIHTQRRRFLPANGFMGALGDSPGRDGCEVASDIFNSIHFISTRHKRVETFRAVSSDSEATSTGLILARHLRCKVLRHSRLPASGEVLGAAPWASRKCRTRTGKSSVSNLPALAKQGFERRVSLMIITGNKGFSAVSLLKIFHCQPARFLSS
jgi:hypothetical protein